MPAKKKKATKKTTATKKTKKKKNAPQKRKAKKKKSAAKKKKAPRKAKRATKKKAAKRRMIATTMLQVTTVTTGMKGVPSTKATTATPASSKPVWQKLHVKGGFVRAINVPAGYEDTFAGSPAQPVGGNADTVCLWVHDHAELEAHLATASGAVNEGGMLLICYPKGQKDIHRDTLWKAVGAEGWEAVALVAVDDTWSAMRFKRKATAPQ